MKIRWLKDCELQVVDYFDEENDNIEESHKEIVKEDEVDEVELEASGHFHWNIQFPDGSVAYGIHNSAFELFCDEKCI